MTGGARALRHRGARASRRARRPTSPSCDLERRRGRSARRATRAAPTTPASRGRELTGRVLMTVAAGQVAFRQRSFAAGGRRREPAKLRTRDRTDAGRGRRPGGLPQGDPGLRAGARRRPRRLIEGAEALGIPIVDHRAVPEGARGDRAGGRRASARGRPSRSRRSSSRPPRPRASTSAAASRRSSAGSRPTSASTRPCSTCSTRASRSRSPRTRSSSRTDENKRVGLHKMERAARC